MNQTVQWPSKTRDIHNHHMDSTIWDELKFRDDDIIIGTYAKAGTTWTQQIIGQLVFNGDPAISAHDYSPWLDIRIMPKEDKLGMMEAQTNRRFIKTHLPLDALTFHPPAKYLYVARDFPDIVWSLHNHLHNATDMFYEMFNETPGLVGPKLPRPPADVYEFWKLMLHGEYPMWSFWENIRTWWDYRHLPNIKLVHFNDLKKDMEGEIREIAGFLDMTIDESRWPAIVEHCSFDWMKANAEIVYHWGRTSLKVVPRLSSTRGPTSVGRMYWPTKILPNTRPLPRRSLAMSACTGSGTAKPNDPGSTRRARGGHFIACSGGFADLRCKAVEAEHRHDAGQRLQ